MKKLVKKYFPYIADLICFCGGSYCIASCFFGVSMRGNRGAWSVGWSLGEQFSMAIGVVLIVLGFLIRSWRKNSQ